MNNIIIDNRLNIPLYHGTSSLFIDSILSLGLGKANPLKQLNAVKLMGDLVKAADKILGADEEWLAYRFQFKWMADQIVLNGGSNFQHGQTYFTPSRISAVKYALSNRFGSELLSNCEIIWSMINKAQTNSYHLPEQITNIFNQSYRPILITAHSIVVHTLLSEDGSSPENNIDKLEMFSQCLQDESCNININFRLIEPLTRNHFSYEYIDPNKENVFY